jgi:hypothetical protein
VQRQSEGQKKRQERRQHWHMRRQAGSNRENTTPALPARAANARSEVRWKQLTSSSTFSNLNSRTIQLLLVGHVFTLTTSPEFFLRGGPVASVLPHTTSQVHTKPDTLNNDVSPTVSRMKAWVALRFLDGLVAQGHNRHRFHCRFFPPQKVTSKKISLLHFLSSNKL